MSVCLCNLSADTVLELAAQNKLEVELASPDPTSLTADIALARKALGELANKLPNPLELLVGSAQNRRTTRDATYHVWGGPLPNNSFFALGEGVYVTSPELTLLQQANQLHQVSLCQMLGRYVGTWSPAKSTPNGRVERAPLTTFESLNAAISEVGHARGKNNLRLAMAYTSEGAASAPETSFQLALCLPPELNGLNILQPTMNYEVGLSSEARLLYPHDSIRIDLCWHDKKFGLEYQGKDHGNRLGADYARWFAARKEGYELWFVANDQLRDAAQMMHIGREVAERIGHDVDEILWPTQDELQDLLDVLAGLKHPKPLTFAQLREKRTELKKRQRPRA